MRPLTLSILAGALVLLGACEPADDSDGDTGETATSATEDAGPARAVDRDMEAAKPGSPDWCRQMAQTAKSQWSAEDVKRYAADCTAADDDS